MKKYLAFLFFTISVFGNTQIITDDSKKDKDQIKQSETPKKAAKKKDTLKTKSGIEIFAGVNPAYTFRTLKINEGLFAKPLDYREEEKAKWTTSYFIGVRTKLNDFLKLGIGVGFYQNAETYDYTTSDSVFRYTNTYRNISFPIRIAYTYGETISFYGGIGIIPKAFLSMKHEETTLDEFSNEQTQKTIVRDKFNMFLIDGVITIGTQIKLGPNLGFFAMLEGRTQLINNFNNQSAYVRKPYALGINLGIEVYL